MNIFNKAERDRKESLKRRREEITRARAYITEGIGKFADLSASFYRGELVRGRANPPYVETCAKIAEFLRQADALAVELESRFIPEKKEKTKFFPTRKSEPEVIDVCPQ